MNRQLHRLSLFVAAVAVMTALGCASSGSSSSEKWKFAKSLDPRRAFGGNADEPPEPQIPGRMVATWVDTVLHSAGKKPQRGFGGRLVFFGLEGKDAVRVDGELVVYAFDESDRPAHETHPTRRYIFPAEQFARQESESKVGPSYSVWLPWDEVGGHQKRISLIARFEPRGGPMLVGEQTAHLLPGIVRPERAMADASPDFAPSTVGEAGGSFTRTGVQPASFTESTPDAADASRRNATTIALPAAMRHRLATTTSPAAAGRRTSSAEQADAVSATVTGPLVPTTPARSEASASAANRGAPPLSAQRRYETIFSASKSTTGSPAPPR